MSEQRKSSRGMKIARRSFLAAAGVIGGGLLVGAGALAWRLKAIDAYRLPAGEGEASFGAWLKFARDGKIEVVVPHQDMGQGIYALAALVAAEGLKVAPDAVRPVPAPVEAHFANPVMLLDGLPIDDAALTAPKRATLWTFDKIIRALGLQGTGGSTSTRNVTQPIRLASASALDMLARAARGQGFRSIAAASGVPEDTVRGRLRRFRSSAGRVREGFTRLAGVLAVDPVPLDPAGSAAGDAVVAVVAAAAAAAGRWPALTVSAWELAAVVTMGSLLSPVVAFGLVRGDVLPSALG